MANNNSGKRYQPFKDYPDVLSVNDLQRALGIGKAAAYTLLASKSIAHIKIGRVYKIPKTALIEYIHNI